MTMFSPRILGLALRYRFRYPQSRFPQCRTLRRSYRTLPSRSHLRHLLSHHRVGSNCVISRTAFGTFCRRPISTLNYAEFPKIRGRVETGRIVEFEPGKLGIVRVIDLKGNTSRVVISECKDEEHQNVPISAISFSFSKGFSNSEKNSNLKTLNNLIDRIIESIELKSSVFAALEKRLKPGKSFDAVDLMPELFPESNHPEELLIYAVHRYLTKGRWKHRFQFIGANTSYTLISLNEYHQSKWTKDSCVQRFEKSRDRIRTVLSRIDSSAKTDQSQLLKSLNNFCAVQGSSPIHVVVSLNRLAETTGLFDNSQVAAIDSLGKQFIHSLYPEKERGSVEGDDAFKILQTLNIFSPFENLEMHRRHQLSYFLEMPNWIITNDGQVKLTNELLETDRDLKIRKEFSDLTAFTLDDESTKDVDDAVAIDPNPTKDGDYRIYVHISDVDRWISPHSHFDIFARSRMTSLYFPEEVVPVFPHALVQKMSIFPDKANEVLSFRIDVNPKNGNISSFDISIGLLTNVAKVSYSQADALLAQNSSQCDPNSNEGLLRRLVEVSSIIEQRRKRDGGLDFLLPTPVVKLNVEELESDPHSKSTSEVIRSVSSDEVYAKSVSRKIIHELMVLAGQAASMYAKKNSIPAPFRSVDPFQRAFPIDHEGKFVRTEVDPLVSSAAMIQSMSAAKTTVNIGLHSGLGIPSYSQATSPIRRYGDLLLHQQIKAFMRQEELPWDEKTLDYYCLKFFNLESEHDLIMLRRNRFWICKYLESKLQNDRDITVDGISLLASRGGKSANDPFTTLILLRDYGIRCKVKSAAVIPLGTNLRLSLSSVDPLLGMISMEQIDEIEKLPVKKDGKKSKKPKKLSVPTINLVTRLERFAERHLFNSSEWKQITSGGEKKSRGRPRKPRSLEAKEDDDATVAPKRKRGRPRKHPEIDPNAPKRKPGRPRKSPGADSDSKTTSSPRRKRGRPRKITETLTVDDE
uniref:Ribonuclease n=1 Tax=Hirondellea gigas TaxID=1518452 RepID=A0A6A7GB92_9CRUS